MNPFFQLDIPKRSSSCFKGGERFVPGAEYYSLVLDEEEQAIKRWDFCPACWNEHFPQQATKPSVTYWKSRIEIKQENLTPSSRTQRALALLKMMLLEPCLQEEEIFVLALFLAHARKLILRKEFEEQGQLYILYEIAQQDEFVTIKKIDLSLLETKVLQDSLSAKLNAECSKT